MNYETGKYIYQKILRLLFDLRFQIWFGFWILTIWDWLFPRRKIGAKGKTVLITGCDTGMGHRMARRFDEMGMHVFAGCLDAEGLGAKSLKEMCSNRLHIIQMDISKDIQVKDAVAYVKANSPDGLHCLINNAGVLAFADLEWMTSEMCQEVININLMGTIRVTKYFLPLIIHAQGRIITITSIVARMSFPQTAVYTATKYGLNGLFSTLRYELRDKGVHLSLVEPGDFSRTTDILKWTQNRFNEMWENVYASERIEKQQALENLKKLLQVSKAPPVQQETDYKILLDDVTDAMLSVKPRFRYVSAPLTTKIKLWILRNLPEDVMFTLVLKASSHIAVLRKFIL